ncbi:MFS transporter [Mucilaginibacter aquaedulcis]|uniref:MFS transporter n=1 Tax=Mucilaginibacter aquaedulcis TaxID=1187081 RepID=UPI0025B57F61|nr:MFS transporter [Mucilaginibacter aquaedulcis]MDN3548101.1 MFS transporter [Mucilaginibacter aquaedulcis]
MKNISQLNLFRALASRNYTLYFIGRAVSQFGTWMQRTAVVWVVYSMTHSALLLGITIFAEQFPSFIFSIPGGVAADRYNRYTVIKITQITSMIQAVLLAILVITGHMAVWAILLLSVILGIINAFDVPARQALINDVVASPADLPNALSLSTATASLAQLLGPALSGIVLSAFGAGVCFLLNAASFGAVIISLLLMKLPAYLPKKTNKKVITDFAEGFAYIKNTPRIGLIVIMLAIVSLLVLPFNTVLPVFAKVVFKGDASTFGYINSFVGVGAVIGTIFLASRKPGSHLKQILFFSTVLMGIGLICFSQFKNFPAAMFFAAVAGYGSVAQFTISNIIVQSDAAPEMRGRTIGVLLMAIFGMMPLGSVIIGAATEHIGAPTTVLIQGILAVIIALLFAKFLTGSAKKAIPENKVADIILK